MVSRLRRLAAGHAPVLALVAGLALGAIVCLYLAAVVRLTPVVVAAADLQAGTRLEAASIRVAHLPRSAVHPDALSSPAQALGRTVRFPVLAGEQVLDPKLSGGAERGPVQLLQPGERAFFLPLGGEHAYPADLVRPGDRVDLVFVSEGRPDTPSLARLLLAGVRVVSAVSEPAGVFGRDSGLQGLVLAVSAPQAERLAYALAHGRIHLLLAGGDPAGPPGAGVMWDNLFEPAAAPPAGGAGGDGR